MSLRNAVLTAVAGALLVWSPTDVAAQDSGLDRAAIATSNAESKAGWKNGRAAGRRTTLPPGISRKSGDRALPPGLRRWHGGDEEPAVLPDVESPSEPEPDPDCGTDIVFIDGMLVTVDCNGNAVGGGGLPGI